MTQHTPLQITKTLLKPWSPCSDGYKWFVAKFPQGAEFTAVQKALREDKRFDDARWLTEKVWFNLILEKPSVTLDVTADHKAEALEIIAETTALTLEVPTAEELGTTGPTATSDCGKADSRIGASGHYTQIGASGDYTRIGASGHYTQIGASGDSTRIGASGDYTQIGASGHYTRIGASGHSTRIGASGDSTRIGASGDSTQIGASGDSTQIGASGHYTQIGASGHYTRINAEGKDSVIACAGRNSSARAGENGVMALPWYDDATKRTRIAVGYVGEDLKANTWYEVKDGVFVEVVQ